jgi:hypothetical protein
MIERLLRWIVKHWRLKSRAFNAWKQKHYARWIEFYATERAIWYIRGRVIRTSSSTKIVKPSRQIHRAIERKFKKLNRQLEKKRK